MTAHKTRQWRSGSTKSPAPSSSTLALSLRASMSYAFDFATSGYISENSEPRRVDAYISMDMFEPHDTQARTSFLSGAYARYGNGSLFRVTNAKHKVKLIRELLSELQCGPSEVVLTNPG